MSPKRKQEEEKSVEAESSVDSGDNSQQKAVILPGFSPEQAKSLGTYIKASITVGISNSIGEELSKALARHFGTPVLSEAVIGKEEEDIERRVYFNNNDVPIRAPQEDSVMSSKRLRGEDVGFFDPEYKDKKSGHSQIVNSGKYIIYRDVYGFIDRLQDLAYYHGNAVVAAIIPKYFRGGALAWYTSELSSLEKTGLRGSSIAI